jgi:rhodanese-related sulfurtransferase
MTPQEADAAAAAGAVVVDMRPPKPFAVEHIPGAVNFQFNRADLADRADMALPRGNTYVVHAEPDPIAKVAVQILAEAGFTVQGYLEGGLKAWKAAGLPTEVLPLLNVDELKDRQGAYRVVDTREGFEYRFGHIPGSELLEWTEAWDEMAKVAADRPLALVCGDQVRSAYVASVLQRLGKPASLVFGGMADWTERGYPVEKSAK